MQYIFLSEERLTSIAQNISKIKKAVAVYFVTAFLFIKVSI